MANNYNLLILLTFSAFRTSYDDEDDDTDDVETMTRMTRRSPAGNLDKYFSYALEPGEYEVPKTAISRNN
jgi:hypothetical protein